uniref:Uncharacterized protein n=1 Tax=Arundo donax TaxID=35708 RepID=A0A0A9H099_ARUDO
MCTQCASNKFNRAMILCIGSVLDRAS